MNRKNNPKSKVLTMRLKDQTYDELLVQKPEGMSWDTFMNWMLDLIEANKTKE